MQQRISMIQTYMHLNHVSVNISQVKYRSSDPILKKTMKSTRSEARSTQ